MFKHYFFIALVILLIGCKQKSQEIENILVINVESKNIIESIKLSELYTDCRYIPLETTAESLIGQLDKIEVTNDNIYTLDSRNAKSVLRFSSNGKFLNRVSKIGRGPGEYSRPDDVSIDPNTGNIAILDQTNVIILKSDNTLVKKLKLPIYAYKIAWYNNRIAAYNRGENDLILLNVNDGRKIGSFFRNSLAKKMVLNSPFQLFEKKQLLYLSNFDYTIHRISENDVSAHVKFVFDKEMFTDNDLDLLKKDKNNANDFVWIKYYNENDTHIQMVYLYKRVPYLVIYSKTNLKTTIVDVRGIQNDITFTNEPPIIMGVAPSGYFMAKFDYSDVNDTLSLKKLMGNHFNNQTLMSNPILIGYKLKP